MVTAKAGLMEARMGHQKVQYLDVCYDLVTDSEPHWEPDLVFLLGPWWGQNSHLVLHLD